MPIVSAVPNASTLEGSSSHYVSNRYVVGNQAAIIQGYSGTSCGEYTNSKGAYHSMVYSRWMSLLHYTSLVIHLLSTIWKSYLLNHLLLKIWTTLFSITKSITGKNCSVASISKVNSSASFIFCLEKQLHCLSLDVSIIIIVKLKWLPDLKAPTVFD